MLLRCSLLATVLTGVTFAQTPAPQQDSAPPPPPGTAVINTGTQLVVVDIVVQDKGGNPVRGLKRQDFQLLEDKKPQTTRSFDEHTSEDHPKEGLKLPPFPPGTFTDYTPVAPNSTLNILLLDTLNTPMKDQAFVRNQLQQFVKHANPSARIAIFGLSTRLYLLQGFTSDPEILKDAVDHHLIPRGSALLDDPTGSNTDSMSLSDLAQDNDGPGMDQVVASLQQFEAEQASFQLQLRAQYTMDAFNALGHYLANFPGRKNLIWFSGSFPLEILPDPTITNGFAVAATNEEEFRETTNLLTRAQVAVYPLDARGLMTNPAFDAANSGHSMTRTPSGFANANLKFEQSQAQEHATMEEMAADTGGHAFYNTNGLADAVDKAINAGSNYYTLTYSPTNHKWDGGYRTIKLQLSPELAARGLALSYRRGYYADDPFNPKHGNETASMSEAAVAAPHTAAAYARSAMSRGAPTPSDILFKVRVLPHSTSTEDKVADGNQPDPQKPIKAPFRRYDIDYAALPDSITFNTTPDGVHHGALTFQTFVFDNDGALLNTMGKTIEISLKPDEYKKFMAAPGIGMHLEVSTPAKGESFLRIGIQDTNSNRFGVIEIPTSRVARLQPLSATPVAAPAAAPPRQ